MLDDTVPELSRCTQIESPGSVEASGSEWSLSAERRFVIIWSGSPSFRISFSPTPPNSA